MDAPLLGRGDRDPNRTFAAVGYALTCWERLEASFAELYTVLTGQPFNVEALTEYGRQFGTISRRQNAVEEALSLNAHRFLDQEFEGGVGLLVRRWRELSLARHRIAHGELVSVPVYEGTSGMLNFSAPSHMEYRIGAPMYATRSLQTSWFGVGSEAIDQTATEFLQLMGDVQRLIAPFSGAA